MTAWPFRRERRVFGLGDLGVGDQAPNWSSQIAAGTVGVQASSAMAAIAARMLALTAPGDGEERAAAADRADRLRPVERRVQPDHDLPGAAAVPRGGDGAGGQAGRAARGRRVAAPQPGGGDHWRSQRRADRGGQRVQAPDQQRFPLDLRVPEPRALLLVPEDAFLHRVDIDERQHIGAGQQRRLPSEPGQELPGPPSPAARRCPRYRSAGANRASTGRGSRRTGCPSRRAAACPCHRSNPRPRPSQRPGTGPSDAR